MTKFSYKSGIFLLVFLFGLFYSFPSFFNTSFGKKINLGLDLQGGLYMLLGVKTQDAVSSKLKAIATSMKYSIEKENILTEGLRVRNGVLSLSLLDADDIGKMNALLKGFNELDVQRSGLNFKARISDEGAKKIEKKAVLQAVETIRNRLDQFGLAEPTVARQGEDNILVELPGIKTAADEQRARALIAKQAKLQLMEVDDLRMDRANTMTPEQAANYGDLLLPDANNPRQKYVVKELPILDGSALTDAKVAFGRQGSSPVINFSLDSGGAKKFGDYTGTHVGKRLAIVLDGKVYSAPVINERIGGGHGQISGGFSMAEASDVAIALRSGALLAPVKMLEKRSIGPSLGADSIKTSMIALVSAFGLIVLFMLVYYGVAGVFADIALFVNILALVAIMTLFGATLTLPGMAGIVLTVGVAVDANVIINERIRELIKRGVKIRTAIEEGYKNAQSAILDSNITSLITAVALYAYGSGPIKGFAVTLGIGILVSMITAIIGTHGMFELFYSKIEKSKNTNFWLGYKDN